MNSIYSKTHQGHTAKKRFGQNFLVDNNIINAIVSTINPKLSDFLIEIGPGLGALTRDVCEKIDNLTVIEVDNDIVARLSTDPFLSKKLRIINQDVLTVNFQELIPQQAERVKIFGNLPYNISTPLMLHLFKQGAIFDEMTFMLQKEVVDRLIAAPNSKDYGRLSLITQYYCKVLPVCEVPPESFRPAPKVDSAVVKLIPYKELPLVANNMEDFERLTSFAFSQRRKTVKNALSNLFDASDWEIFATNGIDETKRPENLTLAQYVFLSNYATEHNSFAKLPSNK